MVLLFQTVTEEKYDVKRCVEEAAIVVTNNIEPKVSCTITLTSPIMRESSDGGINLVLWGILLQLFFEFGTETKKRKRKIYRVTFVSDLADSK